MKRTQLRNSNRVRRGTLMIEMVVCTVLLSIVTAVMVPGIYAVHQQRIATRFDTLTLIELNNLASRFTHQDSAELTLSPWFISRYPDTTLTTDEVAASEDSPLPAVRLTVTRKRPSGHPELKRSLVVWKSGETAE